MPYRASAPSVTTHVCQVSPAPMAKPCGGKRDTDFVCQRKEWKDGIKTESQGSGIGRRVR